VLFNALYGNLSPSYSSKLKAYFTLTRVLAASASRQTTGAYLYHCAFTLAWSRALAEITRANIHVHSRCQRSARAFTRVAEQEVGDLSIISINFLLTHSRVFAVSTPHERSLRVLAAVW